MKARIILADPAQEIREPHARLIGVNKNGKRYSHIHHSRKPETLQDRIDEWLDPYIGDFCKVELFATRERPGWICLGESISGNDIREDLANV